MQFDTKLITTDYISFINRYTAKYLLMVSKSYKNEINY